MWIKPNPPKFLDLLNEVMDDDDKERAKQKHSDIRHYPSSASYKKPDGTVIGACLRQLYWRNTGEVPSDAKEFTTKLQADFGNGIHDKVLEKLKKSKKIKIEGEAKGRIKLIGLDNEISYRLDGLVNYQGERGGFELKTMQSRAVQDMVKKGQIKENHLLQIISYFIADESLRWFGLVYVGRDTAFRAEYHIYKDEQGRFVVESVFPQRTQKISDLVSEGIIARWKELEAYLRDKKLPNRDYKAVLTKEGKFTLLRTKNYVDYKTDFECRYCPFRTKCWSMADAKEYSRRIPGD
jgi:hypothetical protein